MKLLFARGVEDNVIWIQMNYRGALPLWQAITDGIKSLRNDPTVERAEQFGGSSTTRFFLFFKEPASKENVERVAVNLLAYIDEHYHPRGTVMMDLTEIVDVVAGAPRRGTPTWTTDILPLPDKMLPAARQRRDRPVSQTLLDGLDAAIARGEITYRQAWEAMKTSLNVGDEATPRSDEQPAPDSSGGEA